MHFHRYRVTLWAALLSAAMFLVSGGAVRAQELSTDSLRAFFETVESPIGDDETTRSAPAAVEPDVEATPQPAPSSPAPTATPTVESTPLSVIDPPENPSVLAESFSDADTEDEEQAVAEEQATTRKWGKIMFWLAWGLVAILVLFVVWWGSNIMRSLRMRKQYHTPQVDGPPSANERLLNELALMEVALLRGNVQALYEKVYALLVRLLRTRGLTERQALASHEVLERLRMLEVDPTFLDCVESIVHRCDAVLKNGERPGHEEHQTVIRDIGTLIRMRATVGASNPPTDRIEIAKPQAESVKQQDDKQKEEKSADKPAESSVKKKKS